MPPIAAKILPPLLGLSGFFLLVGKGSITIIMVFVNGFYGRGQIFLAVTGGMVLNRHGRKEREKTKDKRQKTKGKRKKEK